MQSVYWIHDEHETDILTEGYVGISNDPQRRFKEHEDRFGSVKEVIFTFQTRQEAKDKELELRPKWFIGKNIAPGGQGGNRPFGIHTSGWKQTEESKEKRRQKSLGNINGKYLARKIIIEGVEFKREKDAWVYFGEKYNLKPGTVRWRYKNNVPLNLTQHEIMSVKTRENNLKRSNK